MKLLRKRRSQKQGSLLGSVLVYGLRILVYFPLSFVIEPGRVVYDLFQSVRQGHSFAKTLVAAVVWSSLIAGTLSYLYFHFRTDQHEHWLVYAATLLLPRFWSWFVRPFLGLTAPPPSGDEFYRSRKWRELRYDILRERGSYAAPGFMKPEGVVVFHTAGNVGFKKTIEKDELPKALAALKAA